MVKINRDSIVELKFKEENVFLLIQLQLVKAKEYLLEDSVREILSDQIKLTQSLYFYSFQYRFHSSFVVASNIQSAHRRALHCYKKRR